MTTKLQPRAFSPVSTSPSRDDITRKEFLEFWQQVKKSGYSEEDINSEIDEMLNSADAGKAAWVDWKDDRDVGNK